MFFIRLTLLSIFFIAAQPHGLLANEAGTIDRSTPQSTYETCYGTINLQTPPRESKRKIKACLTHTAQKSVLSYAVLGAHFIDGLKTLKGKQKYPDFLGKVEDTLNKHELLGGSRMAFQQADLAAALSDLLAIYAAHDFVIEQFQYSARNLEDLEEQENTAQGLERFKLAKALPANRLALNFIKIDDQWMINHISHRY